MNTAYKNMRDFWLDAKNLENKKGVPTAGEYDICIAGVEMAMRDEQGYVKNLLVAGSTLGDSSMYFENQSESGLGGFLGNDKAKDVALKMIAEAAKMPGQMEPSQGLPELKDTEHVLLFAVSKDGRVFRKELLEKDARNPENPFYPFFAYSQQLIGVFRSNPSCGCR